MNRTHDGTVSTFAFKAKGVCVDLHCASLRPEPELITRLFPPTILQTGDTVEYGLTRHVVLAVGHKVAVALELELVVGRGLRQ